MSSALRALTEYGYHRAEVDEIAAYAEVARTALYNYFDEQLDLLLALSVECCLRVYLGCKTFKSIRSSGGP